MKLSPIAKFLFFRVINTERSVKGLVLLFFCLIIPLIAGAQEGSFKASRNEAEAAWDAGNYETAYRHYNALLLLYSRDPLYRYYTGACLVKLEREPSRAVSLLGSAINSSMNVKTIPDDVWFHYGRALQMSGRFPEAAEAFDKFIRVAGKRKSQEYDVELFVRLCSDRQGAIEATHQNNPADVKNEAAGDLTIDKGDTDASRTMLTEEAYIGEVVNVATDDEVPADYENRLKEALRFQFLSDSLSREAQALRSLLTGSSSDNSVQASRAEQLTLKAVAAQQQADRIFLTLEPGSRPGQKTENTSPEEESLKVATAKDSLITAAKKPAAAVATEGKPLYSVFEIRKSPVYSSSNPVPVGKGAPAGLVYRIQLAAFKNPVPLSHFKGLYPLYGKVKPENGVTYYYTGMFRTIESARAALQRVREAGFPDAFIAAMMDDGPVSMERAASLEQEWGTMPLDYDTSGISPGNDAGTTDTIPVGTLYFRAEVLRSSKPVKTEVTEKVELLAGRRGFEIIKNNKGETLLLVGNFITFESADEYVSLLRRNGYTSARVVAYIGKHETDVDKARELIKQLGDD